jgi:adenylate cyclase
VITTKMATARLESMAEAGGICVSAAVRDQVGDKINVGYEDLGEQQLKNINRSIRVFKVLLDGQTSEASSQGSAGDSPLSVNARKPSIAVLPFVNMSGDPEQEFFADGLTEDIITELSRFRELLVISRNAVFTHKGKPVKAREVAREFGVDYVVEGSVRKIGDRVRVTIQLIDGETETHIWAERYDRKLEDIFAIQDEVTSAIAATLFGRVEAARHDRVQRKRTDNMAAYEYVLTGKVLHHWSTREANSESLRMLNRAIELDPKYAHAHAWKACVIGQAWMQNWCEDRDASMRAILDEVQIALSLDDNDADVHRILAALKLTFDEFDKAVYHQERALSLNPNSDIIVVQQGELLTWLGMDRVDSPSDAVEPVSSAAFLESSWPRPIHSAALCGCASIVQQADCTGSCPSCFSCRIGGAVGKSHGCRCSCSGGAPAATNFYRRGLSGHTSPPAAFR